MSIAPKITWNGKSQTITEWAKEAGLSRNALYKRLHQGMSFEKAIAMPLRTPTAYTFNGRTQSLKEWSDELGIEYSTLRHRLRAGYSVERAFTEQVHWGPIRQLALANAIATDPIEAPGVGQDFDSEADDRPGQHRDTFAANRIFEEFSDD